MIIELSTREVLLLRLGLADQIMAVGMVDGSPSAKATLIAELAGLDNRMIGLGVTA